MLYSHKGGHDLVDSLDWACIYALFVVDELPQRLCLMEDVVLP